MDRILGTNELALKYTPNRVQQLEGEGRRPARTRATIMPRSYRDNVFINCPFDSDYKPVFDSLVFVIQDAGFIARCALEISDGTQNRLQKILAIVAECRYGIHDLSRTELDPTNSLPRFNMPFELGLFMGCKWFGNKMQRAKSCLILDRDLYRYQKFISDISGQDIYCHNDQPEQALGMVRNWLRTESKRSDMPGKAAIWRRYYQFRLDLPSLCHKFKIEADELTFADYTQIVAEWLRQSAQ